MYADFHLSLSRAHSIRAVGSPRMPGVPETGRCRRRRRAACAWNFNLVINLYLYMNYLRPIGSRCLSARPLTVWLTCIRSLYLSRSLYSLSSRTGLGTKHKSYYLCYRRFMYFLRCVRTSGTCMRSDHHRIYTIYEVMSIFMRW